MNVWAKVEDKLFTANYQTEKEAATQLDEISTLGFG
jgi:hypothetical protein